MLRPSPGARPSPEPASARGAVRERNAAASRQRLLEAAEREFAARGFAGARLREIADAAGVQPALIHHYFVDKQGIYRAVLDRALLVTSTQSWSLLGSLDDLEGLVRGFVGLLVDFHAAHGNLIAILRHEAVAGGGVAAEVFRERTQPIVEAVSLLLHERQQSGEVRSDVAPREIILAVMSMAAHPFVEAGLLQSVLPGSAPHEGPALEARKRAIVSLLLGGLRPPAE